ncbi:MAG TPA: carbon monoxide dehydrogenase subunit G [Pyrinomonadaceae bacterium]|nr:carbon monoxide dehydrogenase subunit G [Pyrinomonadaceae bacterium]
MKLEGTNQLHAPRESVYQALTDPQILARCIPGCERLERTADNAYAATIRAGVGAIKGIFNSSVRLENMRPPEHYRLVVEGKGPAGFLKGFGDFNLQAQGKETMVQYNGDIQVGGTIASVGQRMIQATAKMMAAQFFTALEAEAKSTDAPPKHGFFRTALRWFSGWLRRHL